MDKHSITTRSYIYLLFLLNILAAGCRHSEKLAIENTQASQDSTSVVEAKEDTRPAIDLLGPAKRKIEENRNNIVSVTGDFNEFKAFTQRLDKFDFFTISTTADYLNEFLPQAEENYQDSAYLHFLYIFYRVANNQTDSLYLKFPETMRKLEATESDSDTQAFEEFLNLFGTRLLMTEGTFYLDANSDYFLSIFSGKVSKAMNTYLKLREQELQEGFSEDGGLMIGFDKVYERVVWWGSFINEYSNSIMIEDANSYFVTYLETLLTGMDNSRVFDFENEKLIPEVKSLYEEIINSGSDSKSTDVIRGYYEILSQNDFKHSDKLDKYLKTQDLSSMLGIQPHVR